MHPIIRNLVLSTVLVTGMHVAIAKEGSQPSQPAKWVSRDVQFIYKGVATQYSCDGLRNSMVAILQALGARKQGLDVHATHCGSAQDGGYQAPGIRATISVLIPATAAEVSRGDATLVRAHWRKIDLTHIENLDTSHGQQCELLEQTQRDLLAQFSTRNLNYSSFCIPNTEDSAGMTFKVEVLEPDSKPAVR